MAFPVPFLAFGVHEHVGRIAGQAEHQDVLPAVAIEVVRVLDEVVGVGDGIVGRLVRARGVVAFRRVGRPVLEVRSEPDVAAGGDVRLAVLVEVGDGAAFGDEVLGDRLLVEGDGRGGGRRGQEEGGEGTHGGASRTTAPGPGCEGKLRNPYLIVLGGSFAL